MTFDRPDLRLMVAVAFYDIDNLYIFYKYMYILLLLLLFLFVTT